jgi:excisionase family DNA binding protein
VSLLALTVSEAADLTSIPKATLEGAIVLGRGPKARRYGKRVIILKRDLEEWLETLPETNLLQDLAEADSCGQTEQGGSR